MYNFTIADISDKVMEENDNLLAELDALCLEPLKVCSCGNEIYPEHITGKNEIGTWFKCDQCGTDGLTELAEEF